MDTHLNWTTKLEEYDEDVEKIIEFAWRETATKWLWTDAPIHRIHWLSKIDSLKKCLMFDFYQNRKFRIKQKLCNILP